MIQHCSIAGSYSHTASSPAYYVAAVTSLFESIALIVDQHQPIVEKYYGQGKMIPVVRQLMQECDRVVNNTISGWEEERQVQRKVGEPYFTVYIPTPNIPFLVDRSASGSCRRTKGGRFG